jgi:hypothetical protein
MYELKYSCFLSLKMMVFNKCLLRWPRIKWRDQRTDDIQEATEKYYAYAREGFIEG